MSFLDEVAQGTYKPSNRLQQLEQGVRHTSWYLVCIASSDSKVAINKATDRERQKQKSK